MYQLCNIMDSIGNQVINAFPKYFIVHTKKGRVTQHRFGGTIESIFKFDRDFGILSTSTSLANTPSNIYKVWKHHTKVETDEIEAFKALFTNSGFIDFIDPSVTEEGHKFIMSNIQVQKDTDSSDTLVLTLTEATDFASSAYEELFKYKSILDALTTIPYTLNTYIKDFRYVYKGKNNYKLILKIWRKNKSFYSIYEFNEEMMCFICKELRYCIDGVAPFYWKDKETIQTEGS